MLNFLDRALGILLLILLTGGVTLFIVLLPLQAVSWLRPSWYKVITDWTKASKENADIISGCMLVPIMGLLFVIAGVYGGEILFGHEAMSTPGQDPRVSVLYTRLHGFFGDLGANPVWASIWSVISTLVGTVMSVVGYMQTYDYLRKKAKAWRKRSTSKNDLPGSVKP